MKPVKYLLRVMAVSGAAALAIAPVAFAEKAPVDNGQPGIADTGTGPHAYPGNQPDVTGKSDSELKSAVEQTLERHQDVSVAVKDRVVTLSGTVASEAERKEAVSAARDIAGVHTVQDQIQVTAVESRSMGEYIDDTVITAELKAKILAEKDLSVLEIKVDTVDGVVTLTGDVASKELSDRAEQVARQVKGVKQVDNKLLIKP